MWKRSPVFSCPLSSCFAPLQSSSALFSSSGSVSGLFQSASSGVTARCSCHKDAFVCVSNSNCEHAEQQRNPSNYGKWTFQQIGNGALYQHHCAFLVTESQSWGGRELVFLLVERMFFSTRFLGFILHHRLHPQLHSLRLRASQTLSALFF